MRTLDIDWQGEPIEVEVDYLTSNGYPGSLEEPLEEPEIEIKSIYVNDKEITSYKNEFYENILEQLNEGL